jgi:hypothetical protein
MISAIPLPMLSYFMTVEEFFTYLSRELNTLLTLLHQASNMHQCGKFLERKHGVDTMGRITLTTKTKSMRLTGALSLIVDKVNQGLLCRCSSGSPLRLNK